MRRQMKLEKQKTKKYATHAQLANDSLGNLRNSPDADSHPLKKRKSDLTLAFVDSSEQVAKLARKSEMTAKIDKMRLEAHSNKQGAKNRKTKVLPPA